MCSNLGNHIQSMWLSNRKCHMNNNLINQSLLSNQDWISGHGWILYFLLISYVRVGMVEKVYTCIGLWHVSATHDKWPLFCLLSCLYNIRPIRVGGRYLCSPLKIAHDIINNYSISIFTLRAYFCQISIIGSYWSEKSGSLNWEFQIKHFIGCV